MSRFDRAHMISCYVAIVTVPYLVMRRKVERSSAIAETARVTIRSLMAVDRLALSQHTIHVNFISLTDLSLREILYPVMLRQLTRSTV